MKKMIQFSGGKDSVVCLHMYKDDPDVFALWVDTGNSWPHVASYVKDTCNLFGVDLVVVSPSIPAAQWQKENGLPSDVVPWDSTPHMKWMVKDNFGTQLVPYTACCFVNIWEPMARAVSDMGVKHIIRGSKDVDCHVGVAHGFVDDGGVYYNSPIWDWSHKDVFNYIEDNDIPMLDNYNLSEDSDSLDCMCCTAYLGKTGTFRLNLMKEMHPEEHALLSANIDRVKATVQSAVAHYGLGA